MAAPDVVGSATTGAIDGASSKTQAHDATGADYLVVELAFDRSATATSVTYAGAPMSLIKRQIQATTTVLEMWGLPAPASGSNNVVATFSTALNGRIAVRGFDGVTAVGIPQGAGGGTTDNGGTGSAAVSVPGTVTHGLVIDALELHPYSSSVAGQGRTESGQTSSHNATEDNGNTRLQGWYTPSAGGTHGVTHTLERDDTHAALDRVWALVAVELLGEAEEGGGGGEGGGSSLVNSDFLVGVP